MNERIKEIIAYLMKPESMRLKDPGTLHSELEDMGYSHAEINRALEMLDFESTTEDRDLNSVFLTGTRILGESEKLILSTSAQGYLIWLHGLGLLSEAQLSLIIENAALEFSPPVSIHEIKEITSRYISDLPEDIPPDAGPRDKQVN